jgi:hypothetical protein
VIVILRFRTEAAFSEERRFRQTMESFLQGKISYGETAQRLGGEPEGVGLALGALFVLGQRKTPGFRLSVIRAPIAYKWCFCRRRLKI